jgi:chaperone required for assembly of F1-ATPase
VRRFWKTVDIDCDGVGWSIKLDGRPVRTPGTHALEVPTESLAKAIADEWSAVGDKVDPRAMPLTGIADAAIDRVATEKHAFAAGLTRYAEADLACYRSEWPPDLVERQAKAWDPLLAWARRRYDVDFSTTSGLIHVPQPPATVDRLAHAVASLDPFRLAALSLLVTIGGSLVAALAVLERAVDVDEAWAAVSLDDEWQLEQWGSDTEAETALHNRRADFIAAAYFLTLLDPA